MSEFSYWQDRIERSYDRGPECFNDESDYMIVDIYESDGLTRWEKDALINMIVDRL